MLSAAPTVKSMYSPWEREEGGGGGGGENNYRLSQHGVGEGKERGGKGRKEERREGKESGGRCTHYSTVHSLQYGALTTVIMMKLSRNPNPMKGREY